MHRIIAIGLLLALTTAPAAFAQSGSEDSLPGLLEDLRRLQVETNAERTEALLDLLRERDLDFELHRFDNPGTDGFRRQGTNIVISFGAGAREIIVGAHYDAAPLGDGLTQGMVDNGAGTIVLTRVAAALADRQLRHRVRVVLFDMEELGLLGSKAFVAELASDRVAAMVNLDIAAAGDTVMLGPAVEPGNAAVYAAAWQVCAREPFHCLELPNYPPSDDRSFQAAGIPNVSIGVVPALEAHQLWLLLNGGQQSGLAPGLVPRTARLIHSADDRFEEVEPRAMTIAYTMVLGTVLELDTRLE